jgi:hypothetical protein
VILKTFSLLVERITSRAAVSRVKITGGWKRADKKANEIGNLKMGNL